MSEEADYYLLLPEVVRLHACLDGQPAYQLFLDLYWSLGAKPGELKHLELGHITMRDAGLWVRLCGEKNDRLSPRRLPLNSPTLETRVRAAMAQREAAGEVFLFQDVSFRGASNALAQAAEGILRTTTPLQPTMLRNSFARHLSLSGVPNWFAGQVLGEKPERHRLDDAIPYTWSDYRNNVHWDPGDPQKRAWLSWSRP